MSGGLYLEFKPANCKDCYRCLRSCPVKAIEVATHQATIIEDRCILCGKCTLVCHQNAKVVHSGRAEVEKLLEGGNVIASVAPSFVSSLGINNFEVLRNGLMQMGFADAEETARGAAAVVECFKQDLEGGKYRNYITSCCPAVNRLIQLYYPDALKYLSPVVSPMVAHGTMLKREHPDARVVFIGPCIAKKREAAESGVIDGVLTFEETLEMMRDKCVTLGAENIEQGEDGLRARYFPIPRGVIKSFDKLPEGYEYLSVDGVERCKEVLENIEDMDGVFIEMNACEYACINGPCAIRNKGGAIKANEAVRGYAGSGGCKVPSFNGEELEGMRHIHKRLRASGFDVSEERLLKIMAKTGRDKPENQLNCGACGYDSCRQKAWAVANGFADISMCLPYMRQRAESLSYEIIQNSPNGILVLDGDMRVLQMNNAAKKMFGITQSDPKGMLLVDFADPSEYIAAYEAKTGFNRKCEFVKKTGRYVEVNAVVLKEHNVLFALYKDITDEKQYEGKLHQLTSETLATTDEVIMKQMRVAQEIASLLGETTAETKVALLKLKSMLKREEDGVDVT